MFQIMKLRLSIRSFINYLVISYITDWTLARCTCYFINDLAQQKNSSRYGIREVNTRTPNPKEIFFFIKIALFLLDRGIGSPVRESKLTLVVTVLVDWMNARVAVDLTRKNSTVLARQCFTVRRNWQKWYNAIKKLLKKKNQLGGTV